MTMEEATLPSTILVRPDLPRVPTTVRSRSWSSAYFAIAWGIELSVTRKSVFKKYLLVGSFLLILFSKILNHWLALVLASSIHFSGCCKSQDVVRVGVLSLGEQNMQCYQLRIVFACNRNGIIGWVHRRVWTIYANQDPVWLSSYIRHSQSPHFEYHTRYLTFITR